MKIPAPESITRDQLKQAMELLGFEDSGRIEKLVVNDVGRCVVATVTFTLPTTYGRTTYTSDIPIRLVYSEPAEPAAEETCTCGCSPR